MDQKNLDRLIALSATTGDRLIVYDSRTEQSIVLLDLDDYERIILSDSKRNVRSLSSKQMLDQINRDIDIWRANLEDKESVERTEMFDEDFVEHPLSDSFEEDYSHIQSWHTAGDVLTEHFANSFPAQVESSSVGEDTWDIDDDIDSVEDKNNREEKTLEPMYQPLPQPEEEAHKPMSILEKTVDEEVNWQEEENVDDEPIFLEEPV